MTRDRNIPEYAVVTHSDLHAAHWSCCRQGRVRACVWVGVALSERTPSLCKPEPAAALQCGSVPRAYAPLTTLLQWRTMVLVPPLLAREGAWALRAIQP